MQDKHTVDMLNGDLKSSIIRYALPLMASGFLQLLFNAADLVVVGKYCGSQFVGAVGAVGPLYNLVVNFVMGCSVGVSVVIATSLGENNWKKANRTVHACFPLAIAFGVLVALAGWFLARPVLVLMSTPEDILEYSITYVRLCFLGTPANLVYNYGASILKANGDTRRPLLYLTLAGVLNILLNVIFVTVFDLNVAGVAIATALSNTFAAVLTIKRLTKLTNCCRLQYKYMRFYTHACLRILKVGLPAGIQNCMFSFANIIIQKFINGLGTEAISGGSAAQSLNGFQYCLLAAIAQAAATFVGQNYGAQQYDRIKKIKNISLVYLMIFTTIITSILYFAGKPLLSIYVGDSPAAVEAGYIKLIFVGCFSVLNCIFDTYSGILRGIGSSLAPAIISITCICGVRLLYLYTLYQLPTLHTPVGLYLCYPISWTAALLVAMLVYRITAKKQFAVHEEQMEEFQKDTFRESEATD